MTRIITVVNRKGGVGKTTTVISLGHGLAMNGKSVLLVDVDPQGHLAPGLGLEQAPGLWDLLVGHRDLRRAAHQARPGLELVPGNARTAAAQTSLTTVGAGDDTLKTAVLGKATGGHDYVIFDTAPSVGRLQVMALWAADLVIIPSAVDFLSSAGLADLVGSLDRLKGLGWAGAVLGVLPTFFDDVTKESRTNLEELRTTFGDLVLAPIHRATLLRECTAEGLTVFEKGAKSRAAQEYAALVKKLLDA
jgi:chromosome partitioning protein